MKGDNLHIAFTIDDDYAQHLGVAIISIILNNESKQIIFHVISNDLQPRNQKKLAQILRNTNHQLHFYQLPNLKKYKLKVDGHATSANYYRLFITEILPQEITKVMYLDADLVVLSDIQSLWENDVENYALAAVHHPNPERANTLHIPAKEYFNSGVMLINLKWWRKKLVVEQFIDFIKNNADKIKYWDQDVLNFIFNGKVLYLNYSYNYQKNNIVSNDTSILHYTGKLKPWHYHYPHPNRQFYFLYLRNTPWKLYGIKYYIFEGKNIVKLLHYLCSKRL